MKKLNNGTPLNKKDEIRLDTVTERLWRIIKSPLISKKYYILEPILEELQKWNPIEQKVFNSLKHILTLEEERWNHAISEINQKFWESIESLLWDIERIIVINDTKNKVDNIWGGLSSKTKYTWRVTGW